MPAPTTGYAQFIISGGALVVVCWYTLSLGSCFAIPLGYFLFLLTDSRLMQTDGCLFASQIVGVTLSCLSLTLL